MGKYRIDRVLGSGGMGTVFAAHHALLDEMVALKVVAPEVARCEDTSARFLLEARASARLKSDHVARVIDIDVLDGALMFLVMELLEGVDLAEKLEHDGPMSVSDAVDLTLQALEGLSHAHAAGIVHRDIKPSNLFLANRDGGAAIVKVLDFGISKSTYTRSGERLAALTGEHKILGSPGYMSLEQILDSGKVDARTDIFSIGAVLYELLTGKPPWQALSVTGCAAAMVESDPISMRTHRPELPIELEAIVFKCLNRRPDDRYRSVAMLAHALEPFATPAWRPLVARIEAVMRRPTPLPSALGERDLVELDTMHANTLASAATEARAGSLHALVAPTSNAALPTHHQRFVRRVATLALALGLAAAGFVALAAPGTSNGQTGANGLATPNALAATQAPSVAATLVASAPSVPAATSSSTSASVVTLAPPKKTPSNVTQKPAIYVSPPKKVAPPPNGKTPVATVVNAPSQAASSSDAAPTASAIPAASVEPPVIEYDTPTE